MTTVQNIRDRASQRLSGETTPLIDRLAAAVADTVTEALTVEFSEPAIDRGSIIEIDTELMYVTSRSGATVNVIRGWMGTTAATHADNATVYVNPRFTNGTLVELIGEEIKSWPLPLGAIVTDEITVAAGEWIADIPDDSQAGAITRILDAKLVARPSDTTPRRDRIDVSLIADRDADEHTSGYAIQLPHVLSTARDVQLDYLVEYDLSAIGTLSTDLETDIGVRDELMDVLVYGTMWRAMSTMEVGRTETAAIPSHNTEAVPPTYMNQTAESLRQIRNQRLSEEVARMNGLYPTLMSTAQA